MDGGGAEDDEGEDGDDGEGDDQDDGGLVHWFLPFPFPGSALVLLFAGLVPSFDTGWMSVGGRVF